MRTVRNILLLSAVVVFFFIVIWNNTFTLHNIQIYCDQESDQTKYYVYNYSINNGLESEDRVEED